VGDVNTIIEMLGNTGSFLGFAVGLLHRSTVDFMEVGYFCIPAYVHIQSLINALG